MCSLAAENGRLEWLKHAHENGCWWNENTCINAAESGHLACLKYAHENGCPIDEVIAVLKLESVFMKWAVL